MSVWYVNGTASNPIAFDLICLLSDRHSTVDTHLYENTVSRSVSGCGENGTEAGIETH